jgi:hypothetical protein
VFLSVSFPLALPDSGARSDPVSADTFNRPAGSTTSWTATFEETLTVDRAVT